MPPLPVLSVCAQTYGLILMTELPSKIDCYDVLTLVMSALCHDLDHPGYNNTYQVLLYYYYYYYYYYYFKLAVLIFCCLYGLTQRCLTDETYVVSLTPILLLHILHISSQLTNAHTLARPATARASDSTFYTRLCAHYKLLYCMVLYCIVLLLLLLLLQTRCPHFLLPLWSDATLLNRRHTSCR